MLDQLLVEFDSSDVMCVTVLFFLRLDEVAGLNRESLTGKDVSVFHLPHDTLIRFGALFLAQHLHLLLIFALLVALALLFVVQPILVQCACFGPALDFYVRTVPEEGI